MTTRVTFDSLRLTGTIDSAWTPVGLRHHLAVLREQIEPPHLPQAPENPTGALVAAHTRGPVRAALNELDGLVDAWLRHTSPDPVNGQRVDVDVDEVCASARLVLHSCGSALPALAPTEPLAAYAALVGLQRRGLVGAGHDAWVEKARLVLDTHAAAIAATGVEVPSWPDRDDLVLAALEHTPHLNGRPDLDDLLGILAHATGQRPATSGRPGRPDPPDVLIVGIDVLTSVVTFTVHAWSTRNGTGVHLRGSR